MKTKKEYDKFLEEIQKPKMKELWDNKEDEELVNKLKGLD